jgi:hypothetical protein
VAHKYQVAFVLRTFSLRCANFQFYVHAYCSCPYAQLGDDIEQVARMVGNTILGCHCPEVDYVRVISECDNAGFWNILQEEGFGPTGTGGFGRPCLLEVSSQAMHEHDAVAELAIGTLSQEEPHHSTMASLGLWYIFSRSDWYEVSGIFAQSDFRPLAS